MGDVIYLNERIAGRERMRAGASPDAAGAGQGGAAKVRRTGNPDLRAASPRARRHATGTRGARQRPASTAAFFFELGCPFSYVAAERVERTLGAISWVPTASLDRTRGVEAARGADVLEMAGRQAAAMRLPLIEPENFVSPLKLATRAAAYAASQGGGPRFALAAFRLSFCGGYDLEDPAIIGEAAAAAGLGVVEVLTAAKDPRWDIQPRERHVVCSATESPVYRRSESAVAGSKDLMPSARRHRSAAFPAGSGRRRALSQGVTSRRGSSRRSFVRWRSLVSGSIRSAT